MPTLGEAFEVILKDSGLGHQNLVKFAIQVHVVIIAAVLQKNPEALSRKDCRDRDLGPIEPGCLGISKVHPARVLDARVIGRNGHWISFSKG